MNLLTCFVRTTKQDELVAILLKYSGIQRLIRDAPVPGPACQVLADVEQPPSVYVINSCTDWVVMEVNSLLKLHELGRQLSANLQTTFIQIIYCAVVEYAYMLVCENGSIIREIESKGGKEIPDCNIGEQLSFELCDGITYFDLDTIADYCQQFGIDISNMFEQPTCTVLQGAGCPAMFRLDQDAEMTSLLYPLR